MADIDLSKLEAQIAEMSEEEIKEQLLAIRTRQRVMQKKYNDPVKSKARRDQKAALVKLMTERAKAAGIYDSIVEQAKEDADAKLAEQDGESDAVENAA